MYSFLDEEFANEKYIKSQKKPYVDAKYLFFWDEKADEKKIIKNYRNEQEREKLADVCLRLRGEIWKIKIPIITMKSNKLNEIIEIFSDINTKGTRLDLFDLVYAKWIDSKKEFDLKEYKKLGLKWKPAKRSFIIKDVKLSGSDFVRCLYIQLKQEEGGPKVSNKDILETNPRSIIKDFDHYLKNIGEAISFLKPYFYRKIPSYNLIRITSYFFKCINTLEKVDRERKNMNAVMKYFKEYVINACLNNRYEKSTGEKVKTDLKNINQMIQDDDFSICTSTSVFNVRKDNLESLNFAQNATKDSMCYFLFVNALKSKDFTSGRTLLGDEEVEYHHIIAKSLKYLDNKGKSKEIKKHKFGNTILNFAPLPVDDHKKIGKKTPAKYLEEMNISNKWHVLNNLCIDYDLLSKIDEDEKEKLDLDDIEKFWEQRRLCLIKLVQEKINEYIDD